MAAKLSIVRSETSLTATPGTVAGEPEDTAAMTTKETVGNVNRRINPEPKSSEQPSRLMAALRSFFIAVAPPLVGTALLLLVWAIVAQFTHYLPGPGSTFLSAIDVFSHPFYVKGPNDQGIGWNLLSSLWRVAKGFGLAAAIGIPLGFMLGRFALLNRVIQPVISLLRPVSPLAWLPIGLAIFEKADPAAVFCIFICSIWPMIINTALGVASVPQDYLNVARVLRLSEWKVFTRILLPASIPYVLSGAKLALGIAWLVIVASEMLTGGVGIGFWLWDEWNNLNMQHILIAIGIIGVIGLLLEKGMDLIAKRFDYRQN